MRGGSTVPVPVPAKPRKNRTWKPCDATLEAVEAFRTALREHARLVKHSKLREVQLRPTAHEEALQAVYSAELAIVVKRKSLEEMLLLD